MSIFSQVFDRQIFYEQAFYPKVFYEKLLTEEIRECVHDTRKCKSYLELYDHYKTKTAALEAAGSLLDLRDNAPAYSDFPIQYSPISMPHLITTPEHLFCAASALPNTPPWAWNTFHGSGEASPASSTPYLNIISPICSLPKGSPVSERDDIHNGASTSTLGSRSEVYRPSRKRSASSLIEKDIQEEDLDPLLNREVVSAENAVEETGKRRRVATVKERA